MEQKAQRVDRHVTTAMRDNLFGSEEEMGMDIVALNIQRGRDHGLQPYYQYRRVYDLKPTETWAQMQVGMSSGRSTPPDSHRLMSIATPNPIRSCSWVCIAGGGGSGECFSAAEGVRVAEGH